MDGSLIFGASPGGQKADVPTKILSHGMIDPSVSVGASSGKVDTDFPQASARSARTVNRSGTAAMPAFGDAYSDVEIAAVANHVTARFGAKPSAIAAADFAKLRLSTVRPTHPSVARMSE